jgi:regulatory protein
MLAMSWNRTPKQDLAGGPALVLETALRYLSRREYMAAELRQRLKERGAAAEDIEAALEYLQGRGYQDDARAAESHIRQRLAYAPRGRALVKHELKERGLSSVLCNALLEEHYPPEMERQLLQRLLAKEAQFGQTRLEQAQLVQAQPEIGPSSFGNAQNTRKLRQKMARRLLAKGFEQSLVLEVLKDWLPQEDDVFFVD